MSDWRVYSAEVDLKTGKFLLRGEMIVTQKEWIESASNLMRQRNLAEKIVYDNIQEQKRGDDD